MNKNNLLIGMISLLVGVVGTNLYHTGSQPDRMEMMSGMQGGSHMMPDGTMMGNGGMNMAMDMDSMMEGMLANMRGKSGAELEKAFIADMIPHHQGAVDMAKLLLQDKTVRPELVKFANEIITAQEQEIGQMKEWQKSY